MQSNQFAALINQATDVHASTFPDQGEPVVVIRAGEFGSYFPVQKVKVNEGKIILQYNEETKL